MTYRSIFRVVVSISCDHLSNLCTDLSHFWWDLWNASTTTKAWVTSQPSTENVCIPHILIAIAYILWSGGLLFLDTLNFRAWIIFSSDGSHRYSYKGNMFYFYGFLKPLQQPFTDFWNWHIMRTKHEIVSMFLILQAK